MLIQEISVAGGTFLRDVALILIGTGTGMIPSLLKSWRRDLIAEGARKQLEATRDLAITNEATQRGKLEARVERLQKDIQGVADMVRTRFEVAGDALDKRLAKLEKKDTALETLVTGQLPRVSGESGAIHG